MICCYATQTKLTSFSNVAVNNAYNPLLANKINPIHN